MSKINNTETEWTLILRKHGILPPAEKEEKKEPELPDEKTIKQQVLENASLQQLERLDEYEFEDEAIIQMYKQKRLKELKEQAQRNKYGYLKSIQAQDWITEITKAEKGVWVIVFLWASSPKNDLMHQLLTQLAFRHKYAKFLKIKGTDAIKNFPDRNCPALLVYKDGEMQKQFIPFTNLEDVDTMEWMLAQEGILQTELTEKPQKKKKAKQTSSNYLGRKSRYDDEEEDDEEDDD